MSGKPLFSNTPGDEMILSGLAPVLQKLQDNETKVSSPTVQIQSEDDWRRLRRNIITRRR